MGNDRAANWKRRNFRNPDTGEYMEWDEDVPVKPKRPGEKRTFNKDFHLSYHDKAAELANMNLTGNDRRVLIILTSMMEQNKPFRYSTKVIAETLGMLVPAVSRSIRNLRDEGLIIQVSPLEVYLDPEFYWRGGEPERAVALALVKKIRAANATDGSGPDGGAGK